MAARLCHGTGTRSKTSERPPYSRCHPDPRVCGEGSMQLAGSTWVAGCRVPHFCPSLAEVGILIFCLYPDERVNTFDPLESDEGKYGRVPLSHPRCHFKISTRLYTVTMRRAFVRHTGHTLYGPESNRLVLPSHYQIGIAPPEGCAHFSLRQLPTRPYRPYPTRSSANPLPGSSCRVPDTAWRDHPPSAESPQHSPC